MSVAASISTMSTPTPYRAMTWQEVSVWMRARSILANCTISACAPAVAASSPARPVSPAVIRSMGSPELAKTSDSTSWPDSGQPRRGPGSSFARECP